MWSYKAIRYSGKQFGEYVIEKPIGEGRYGLCFLARSKRGQKVVIKKFRSSLLKKSSEKNIYEAVVLSKLNDKRIPELLGVINEKGFYGFVLEYKQGVTVKDMLFKYRHNFSQKEIFNIGIKLINIISYLHENGIVHRDIRIPNVLVDNDEVYLIDFGLARWADNDRYPYDSDFSYLGDFLLYLFYSSYSLSKNHKKLPWYNELPLTYEQKVFLKKLLRIELVYEKIQDIEKDFIKFFKIDDQ